METIKSLTKEVAAATGSKKAQLVLKNARIVNVFTQSVEEGDIAIEEGRIVGIGNYDGVTEKNLDGAYVCPGFLDGHIHIESSMTSPGEFERAVVPHGTTAVITDPHEITNVAGEAGIRFMMQSAKKLNLDVYFMLPSCVPATDLDESGAELLAADLEPFYIEEKVLGLAEVMNAYGVTHGDKDCLEKLIQARSLRKAIDGHAPALSGKELNAYVTAGIRSDHECSCFEEAREKFARGQWIMIRLHASCNIRIQSFARKHRRMAIDQLPMISGHFQFLHTFRISRYHTVRIHHFRQSQYPWIVIKRFQIRSAKHSSCLIKSCRRHTGRHHKIYIQS